MNDLGRRIAAALLIGAVVCWIVVRALACTPPGPALTARDGLELGSYGDRQEACLFTDASIETKKACVADVRKQQCAAWATRFDAAVCP